MVILHIAHGDGAADGFVPPGGREGPAQYPPGSGRKGRTQGDGTGYKLVLERAKVDLFYAGSRVMSIILHGRVEVPRRTTGSFTSLWRVRTTDPMAYYVMVKKIREDDISQVAVSFAVEGRGGPASVKNSEEMVPLSEFLNIFGLSLQDVKNYLDE